MKGMSLVARLYIYAIYLVGAALLTWNLIGLQVNEPFMLVTLCLLASLALIFKVEGTTNRSHYSFSFIVFGFALIHGGISEAVIVVMVSSLVEYLIRRPRPVWFIQIFNAACYVAVLNVAGSVFTAIAPAHSLMIPLSILAIILSMVAFTLLNHLIVGIIVWLARGEDFKKSGIFDLFPLFIDLTLLSLGAMLVLIWEYSPYALILFAFPIYLIYGTMRVPALERQTEIDPKTGLYNHNYFKQHLENELKRANRFDHPLTIIMADLDLLRNINNTYGHLAGDQVLIGVAKILQSSVREYDVVARFGGEEFSILMPETELDKGYKRAEAIRKAIQEAAFIVPTSVSPIKTTISLGVATRETFEQSGEEIIHHADAALYNSKLQGRNRVFAYSQQKYTDFHDAVENVPPRPAEPAGTGAMSRIPAPEATDYQAAKTEYMAAQKTTKEPDEIPAPDVSKPVSKKTKLPVLGYIGGLFVISILAFGGLYQIAPDLYTINSLQSWMGLLGCALLVILTEWYSIDLYTKTTSLSTSAVPILVGTLLYGPIASLVLSFTYAIILTIKFRSPLNRLVFNFSNQLIAGMIYTALIHLAGISFVEASTIFQLILAVASAILVFLLNTVLISIGISIDSQQPFFTFWKENYSWLFSIYLGMGVVAAAFVFGYKTEPIIGSLLVIVPLLLLRISQVQYVERTRTMVVELRDKNTALKKSSDENKELTEGLLDTLAKIIDLRDPYVLGHSRGVSDYAVILASRMGLNEKQVDLVRKGSLLHDIGKIGISEEILSKPAPLSPQEYEIIQSHPASGSSLLEKEPYLRQFIPIVRNHHEHYNGGGYPDKIAGRQIPVEARIVSVADAIEAMFSDRPYRKARSTKQIIQELKRCSGSQFDPQVVEKAVSYLESQPPDQNAKNPQS